MSKSRGKSSPRVRAAGQERLSCFTIGYEGRSVDEVLDRLVSSGIGTLLDIRLRPSSRKPGLSKNGLAHACADRGLTYVHDGDLGTPPDLMEHVREGKGYDADVSDAYRRYLLTKEAALQLAVDKVRRGRVCLLCYEADPADCHRKIVAEEIAKRTGAEITHL